jgi:DNA mismatch repair protein MLH3
VSQMNSSKISKVALKNANVIAQVDEKFILVSLLGEEGENLLVAIDQHAADERVKVEELLQGLCSPPDEDDVVVASQPSGLKSVIKTTSLDKPLKFTISAQEVELFRRHARHFADWGILYNQPDDPHIVIHTLPPLIIERCTSNPKLLITLLRTEIWSRHESPTSSTTSPASHDPDAWIKRVATCPKDLLHMAHSRACRSAIMFNDALSLEECRDLVGRLGECVFPFVCAHGRPSLVPLVELGGAGEEVLGGSTEEMVGLGREEERDCFADAWVEWRARGEDEVEDERM